MILDDFCRKLEQQLVQASSCQEKVRITELLLGQLCGSAINCSSSWDCRDGRYARHLVFNGSRSRCCVVAMSWGPGQGTPVHDHDGTWCVECCLEGQLEVVQYELKQTKSDADGPLYVFQAKETQRVGRGAVGCLIPPFEHHTIHNPCDFRADTLHVYGKELTKSACFYPLEDSPDHYRRREQKLTYAQA